jgi:UDPglucose--hexose-1-phosphate uridylyltransferase
MTDDIQRPDLSPSTFAMPDGRSLHLYGNFSNAPVWPPGEGHVRGYSHRRWHPVRREWVVYSAHRQGRTFKPTTDCPLCPNSPDGEIPVDDFEIAVFDNRFSSFQKDCPRPAPIPGLDLPVDSAAGNCEVIVYSADHMATIGSLSQGRRELLVRVWGERVRALMALDEVAAVMPFENRGEEAGVTLHHPHGQIYAFSYMPPVIETMAQSFRDGYAIQPLTKLDAYRTADAETACALVPPFARFPFESWIVPKTFRASPADLTDAEVRDVAKLLSVVSRKYDAHFGRICAYVMIVYLAPKGMEDFFPFHIEYCPLLRASNKLKYLAGCELGSGSFLADLVPENTAKILQNIKMEEVS